MARWEPDARGRLVEAAMELYSERGFDKTTVAEIAERAGLTERTFFRYFTDKREVLFSGSEMLKELLMEKVSSAPLLAPPIHVVIAALKDTSPFFEGRREFARMRNRLIAAHTELQERELIKLARLAAAIGEALRRRGLSKLSSDLAAEAGIAVFKLAFDAWLADSKKSDLTHHIDQCFGELESVIGGAPHREVKRAKKAGRSVH